jgi:hypothetical protein
MQGSEFPTQFEHSGVAPLHRVLRLRQLRHARSTLSALTALGFLGGSRLCRGSLGIATLVGLH